MFMFGLNHSVVHLSTMHTTPLGHRGDGLAAVATRADEVLDIGSPILRISRPRWRLQSTHHEGDLTTWLTYARVKFAQSPPTHLLIRLRELPTEGRGPIRTKAVNKITERVLDSMGRLEEDHRA